MYRLPESLRKELSEPLGPVLSTDEALAQAGKSAWLVAVGDVTTGSFLERGKVPRVIVVDYRTRRSESVDGLRSRLKALKAVTLNVNNPAATITDELWEAVAAGLSSAGTTIIEVDGEEDLAVLPALMLAPVGSLVAYGQPGAGIVILKADAASRSRVNSLLRKMEVK